MLIKTVDISGNEIIDWESFHRIFAEKFGFPKFYGNNMNAWIDCISDVIDYESTMTAIKIEKRGLIVLKITQIDEFQTNCPEIYIELISCVSFVNKRQVQDNNDPILAIMPISS